ncbi:hypothetical protein [Nocardia sp. CC227C]|uniref:hypothetical protein n=1 Tax=Nocardia sp. CC227C TaxID=3044562 RepID=UPI00278BF3B1|nr:hypothetical protein [Nocardia sp. CC227C]
MIEPRETEWAVLTPITDIPHLAEAARRLGQTDREIWVDKPMPPRVHTRGRGPDQWLVSGRPLNAFAAAAAAEQDSSHERGGAER